MIIPSSFKPAWWLPGPHAQTIWPNLFRQRAKLSLTRERFEMPDGDFVDIDWASQNEQPIVLILHGLEGNLDSHYISGLLKHLTQNNFQAGVLYFRGCSGEVNRLPRAYHSGDTGDIAFVVAQLVAQFPDRPIYAIGFSLGGNVLLKWLGETKKDNPLNAAIAISVPFDLNNASEQLNTGKSKIYQAYLVKKLQRSLRQRLMGVSFTSDLSPALICKTIYEYDDIVTAPIHGFKNADDYYQQSSSRQFLATIETPTLIIHAQDDPFMTQEAIPTEAELSNKVQLELSAKGGHVGFVGGAVPFRPQYWLDQRIMQFLLEQTTV